ncbi:hypothetical protein JQ581_28420 [Bradyrhizobium liaoningense]|uniref:hypothetical protein n=1 Tax=Bradyrhizobium liaoningense TaxID=43992 RepID=UPI001BA7CF68|nr:hypothetical protein [Bradyrhizobium liaoningense]MBR0740867.1 hypothetical protein [Bradyrhizobium liaoningense]
MTVVSSEANAIADRRFLDQLRELKNLKQFLFEQKVKFEPDQLNSIDLGSLNNLYFSSAGRLPDTAEWKLLDEKLSALASYLSDELRQKIRIRELGLFFGTVPLTFLLLALATILYRFLYGAFFEKGTLLFNASFLLSLILWTVSQGGLGACAFLGTRIATRRFDKVPLESAIDVADITDESILKIRIILGCLFGSIIGLPIAAMALDKMANAIYGDSSSLAPADFALMILPFLVGFSTNLVLAILERCIESIRTFFGMSTK